MNPFSGHNGTAVVLNRNNIDTDAILPKQYMAKVSKTGYGQFAFDEWRYLTKGTPEIKCETRELNPDFPLNFTETKDASILISGENFGCGSSREHAVWALVEYGFKVIIAKSFADIFYRNCINNGLLAVELPETIHQQLVSFCEKFPEQHLSVDLYEQAIEYAKGNLISFALPFADRVRLLNGDDVIDLTLKKQIQIKSFEDQQRKIYPWLYTK